MLVRLFLLNKESRSVAVSVGADDNYCSYMESNSLYMESPDKAAKRIVKDNLNEELDESRLKLVRQENSTVVCGKSCTVNNIATYVYESTDGEINLTDEYMWVSVGRVIADLCDNNKYFEAAYLSEACDVV